MEYLYAAPLIEKAKKEQRVQCDELAPRLDILLARGKDGENLASKKYVEYKEKYGQEIGADARVQRHLVLGREAIRTMQIVEQLNNNEDCDGMLIQLPLPIDDYEQRINQESEVYKMVDPLKDVDGLAPNTTFEQATPLGIMKMLEGYGIPIEGRTATVNGANGKLVGRAAVRMLWERGAAEVHEIDYDNKDELADRLSESDIAITAVGRPGLITPDMLHDGMAVIDAGVAKEVIEGRETTVGDLDRSVYESGLDIQVTPHIRGAGPMTIVALYDNLIEAARKQQEARSYKA